MYRLLIIDDEFEIRNGLYNYFPWKEVGFQAVGQAENGKKALDFIENNAVDVILSDIKMPVMSGLELAKILSNRGLKIKIIFLSVFRDFEYAKEAMIYGAKNYIIKSTKYDELFSVFSKIRSELDMERSTDSQSFHKSDSEVQYKYAAHTGSAGINEKIICMVKKYVETNYKDATLEIAAEMVHMHPHYLSKFFKQKTGKNFSDYLIDIKMQVAAELLREIQYKTYEVSEMVGYSNSKNFTRTFKAYFGKSPKDFRNGG